MATSEPFHSRFSTLGTTTVPSGSRTTKNICLIGPLIVSEKQISQNGTGICPKLLSLQCSDLYVIKVVMKTAAISAAFSFVTALGEFCSPPSKTYSSVPPSLAAPRHRNSSTDRVGIDSKRVIRIVAREPIGSNERKNYTAKS
jgi:hypothetical protein